MNKPAPRRRAFTLVELLVVIGIIVVLLSILIPVIKKVRYAAYGADTNNELSQLSNACNQYYSSFHAYPGPFSNDQTENVNLTGTQPTTAGIRIYLYNAATSPPTYGAPTSPWPTTNWYVSGTQNLVLGLMGGLRWDATDGCAAFAPSEVGLGPFNLNPTNPGRPWGSFFPNGSNYLMWCEWNSTGGQVSQSTQYQAQSGAGALYPTSFTDQAQTQAQDAPMPVFVDRYPTPGPLPILYLRARVGAPGIISDGLPSSSATSYNTTASTPGLYQYDLRDIRAYTQPNASGNSIGLPISTGHPNHNLEGVNQIWNFGATPQVFYPVTANLPNNAGPYFANIAITPTNTSTQQTVDYTGKPRSVDQFILISAGPDGIYGTPDDLTSFDDVSQ